MRIDIRIYINADTYILSLLDATKTGDMEDTEPDIPTEYTSLSL